MAQEDNIAGLFGPTVEQIQAAQRQQDEANAFKIAQLGTAEQLAFYGARNGSMLGRGLAAAGTQMGILPEDPATNDARVMKQVVDDVRAGGVDVSDPAKFYRQVSDKLAAAGKTGQAMMLSMKAGEYDFLQKKRTAEVNKLNAESLKALREKESQIGTLQREAESAIREGRLDDAAQLEAQIAKLNSSDKPLIETEEGAGMVTVDGKQMPQVRKVLIDPTTRKPVWQGTPFVKGTGQTVNVNNLPPTDDAGVAVLKETQVKAQNRFNESYDAANSMRQNIAEMQNLVKNPKLIQGSAPEIRLEAVRVLNTLGFGDKESLEKMNNSDLFDAYAKNVILPKMRMLGGSDSNEELRAVTNSYAGRKMDIAAIRRLIDAANKDIQRMDKINQAYDDGLSEGRNPLAFNWSTGSWRNIRNLPGLMSTPPGTPAQPGNFPATAPVTVAPPQGGPSGTPNNNTPVRQVTDAMIARYRQAFKDNPRVQSATDDQIRKILGQ